MYHHPESCRLLMNSICFPRWHELIHISQASLQGAPARWSHQFIGCRERASGAGCIGSATWRQASGFYMRNRWKHDGSMFWKLDVWPIIPIFAARNLFGCGIQTHEMNYGFHLHPHQWSLHLRLLKSKPRTTIIIAHRPSRMLSLLTLSIHQRTSLSRCMTLWRLSTVRDANQICVFNHGRIVEKGRHATWLKMFCVM